MIYDARSAATIEPRTLCLTPRKLTMARFQAWRAVNDSGNTFARRRLSKRNGAVVNFVQSLGCGRFAVELQWFKGGCCRKSGTTKIKSGHWREDWYE